MYLHTHAHLPWLIGLHIYIHIPFICSYIPLDMYITLIFNEFFGQQNSMFSNYCSILIVFTQLSSQLVYFCRKYSFSNDYFSLNYFFCTTRVFVIKISISILWCWKFGICFPFCHTRKEQFQNFPKSCCRQNLSSRGKKSVWHNTQLSDFCFWKQHIHFSVVISFWEHNTQYTVNSHLSGFLGWRWQGARNCSNPSILCPVMGWAV
jgi:hypothetical protein